MNKSDIKRDKILSAAVEVFSKEGYHNAKITKIAEIAGIAAGSVYLYFVNKEHLLEEILVRSWSKIDMELLRLEQDSSLSASGKIAKMSDFIVDLVFDSRSIASMILHEQRFWSNASNKRLNDIVNNAKDTFKKIIVDGMKNEDFRANIIPSLAATFLIGGLWHQMEYWAEHFDDYNKDIMRSQASEFLISCLK
jgi:TetR/AcrR family fatty acid metabolism transcriptional regulator